MEHFRARRKLCAGKLEQIENKVYYNKAQLALKANKTYAEALLQKQELNKVDGISGATLSYKQFFDAAQRALEEAGK